MLVIKEKMIRQVLKIESAMISLSCRRLENQRFAGNIKSVVRLDLIINNVSPSLLIVELENFRILSLIQLETKFALSAGMVSTSASSHLSFLF